MLGEIKADLHIHTCLSPCADLTMVPTAIIEHAKSRSLDIIGICDHNSTENVAAVQMAGERRGIEVIGGIEITSREEVHVLGFFDNGDSLDRIGKAVFVNLPGDNDEERFGEQVIVDEHDGVTGLNSRLLIGATVLSVEEIVQLIHGLGGVAVASHIDRETYGIIGQLGFIPDGLSLDALEISPNCTSREADRFAEYGFPLIASSDAHYLDDIGKTATTFSLHNTSFAEIKLALRSVDGRSVRIR